MQVIERKDISAFDCDNTLVMWPDDFKINKFGRIKFTYGDEDVFLVPHSFHPVFLKNCFKRGDYIVVWSQNGFAWAKQVVEKLGLENYVDIVMNKPSRHIDDKENLEEIVGNRVYLPHKENK